MKVASSGSRWTTSSASRRIRAQTGSILSSASLAFTWCWAMAAFHLADGLLPHTAAKHHIWPITWPTNGFGRPSGPLGEKIQHPLLERLVPHRQHVIAPGDVERPARGQKRRQLRRGARDRLLAAD